MEKDLTNNPFASLFKNVESAKSYAEGTKLVLEAVQSSAYAEALYVDDGAEIKPEEIEVSHDDQSMEVEAAEIPPPEKPMPRYSPDIIVNDLLERIFLVTLNYDQETCTPQINAYSRPPVSIKLEELKEECTDNFKESFLSANNLNQALYERLQISDPRKLIFIKNIKYQPGNQNISSACEHLLIKYLCASYCRSFKEEDAMKIFLNSPQGKLFLQQNENFKINSLNEIFEVCRKLIISFTGTILLQPTIFPINQPHEQFLDVLKAAFVEPLLYQFAQKLYESYSDGEDLIVIFTPVLDYMWKLSQKFSLMHPDVFPLLNILVFYSRHEKLALCFLKSRYWLPLATQHQGQLSGSSFEHETLLGRFLRITSIPPIGTQSEHFLKPSQQSEAEMSAITSNIRQYLDTLVTMVHKLLHNLFQLPNMQHEVLLWIGLCLHANEKRSQMYADPTTVADSGFFLNLTHVLLKFCDPFCSPESKLLFKVDCRYGAVASTPESVMKLNTQIHAIALNKYTPMAPEVDDASIIKVPDNKFNFISEIYFLTHLCYKLGFVKMYDQYEELMKRLRKLSNIYQDAQRQGNIAGVIENFKNDFENGIRTQLAAKAHLLNPTFCDLSLKFSVSSGHWLVQQVLAADDYAISQPRELKAEIITNDISPALTVIPEFIAENVGDTVRSLGNFNEESLERCEQLKYVMNFFAVFLGAKCRIKNPHLRAKLAECLAAFLPKEKSGISGVNNFAFSYRKRAFDSSSVMVKILPQSLLQLFVDIEFTGHTMEFDQKFMYRRYMYAILEYIWKVPSYLKVFVDLHRNGTIMYKQEKVLTSFPRFINLLVNDSTFLLDEALQNIVTIKGLEKEKADGEWKDLTEQERQDKEKNLRQCGHMAEGYNTMAKETVHVISYITKEIDRPFVSHVMADSMAAFLNYFFVHLVGPKRKQLKVNDFEKYNFNPGNLVKSITTIYLQLGKHDDFCQAIVKDTRSYSPHLFASAVIVLERLEGAHDMVSELKKLSLKLEKMSEKQLKADAEMPEPPDEFLDPISCELMQEPVKLPSSGKIVCRSTIAKHLLSDEKDPFNRSPLMLDQVTPCLELQEQIQQWMKDNMVEPPMFVAD